MTNLETSSGSWDICSDLKTFHRSDFGASTWLIIPSLNAADPAYGAAWPSEGWAHAVSPVFGGRGRCRLSYLQKQFAHQNFNRSSYRWVHDARVPVAQGEAQCQCLKSLHFKRDCADHSPWDFGYWWTEPAVHDALQDRAFILVLLYTELSIKAAVIMLAWGGERELFERNGTLNSRSTQCHCAWRHSTSTEI